MNTDFSFGLGSNIGNFYTLLTNSIVAGISTIEGCCEIEFGAFILQSKKIVSKTVLASLFSALMDNRTGNM